MAWVKLVFHPTSCPKQRQFSAQDSHQGLILLGLRILKEKDCTAPLGSLSHHLTISAWRNFSLHPIWTSQVSIHFCSPLISSYAQSWRDWLHFFDALLVWMGKLPKAVLLQAESAQLPPHRAAVPGHSHLVGPLLSFMKEGQEICNWPGEDSEGILSLFRNI